MIDRSNRKGGLERVELHWLDKCVIGRTRSVVKGEEMSEKAGGWGKLNERREKSEIYVSDA